MVGRDDSSISTRLQSLSATLRLQGQEFQFRLFTRPLRLGHHGTVQYFWLDSSQFRTLKSDASCAAFQSIVGFWRAAMQEMGHWDELDQQVHYVLAVSYALATRCKRLQAVYRDAHLAPRAIDVKAASLPDDVRQCIRETVQSRDRFRVQEVLDQTLGRFEPPSRMMPLLQEAHRRWVGKGVALMRHYGNDGLERFLMEVDYWLSKYRKRSDRWVRHFINLFAYECKAAFYRCYANTWIALIPWLRENRGLDLVSERFLRFWHYQNQPIEIPHGRTLGGILYPTLHGVTALEQGPGAVLVPQTLIRQTERIGPTHARDVFSGQILGLHPLSGFFMKDPAMRAIAGNFFATEAHDMAFKEGHVQFCSEYWDLVGAILSAAAMYRQALDRQFQERGVHSREGGEAAVANTATEYSDATMLEDFAAVRGYQCTACQGGLRLRRYSPAGPDNQSFVAVFACSSCNREESITIDRDSLIDWLRPGD
jgi:hypothetical protein